MNVVVNGLLTNYQISGKGKLVLILHGWGDSASGLESLTKTLASKYKVLSLDLPGFGATEAPKGVWNLDDYSEFVSSFLTKIELAQPYAVIGHSNGGALSIRAVSMGKLSPDKLILIAASGIRTGKAPKRLILNIIAKTGNIATIWMPERYRQALRKSLYGAAGSDMLVAPHLEETFKQTVRQDVKADAGIIDVPTLLIYGADDSAVPVEDGKQYNALIKGSRLEIIPGAGHFVHLDETAKVNGLVEEFLK